MKACAPTWVLTEQLTSVNWDQMVSADLDPQYLQTCSLTDQQM